MAEATLDKSLAASALIAALEYVGMAFSLSPHLQPSIPSVLGSTSIVPQAAMSCDGLSKRNRRPM